MDLLRQIWDSLLGGLEAILRTYEGLLEPVAGSFAWGWAIILLTITVRIFLIPLMVRQVKSMRGMQKLQPELKKIQAKYKADRSMMKTDPERYKKIKEKQREAQMQLYQEHKVNPVGGCLPLVLQAPIFFALFTVLRDDRIQELATAPFIGVGDLAGTAMGGVGIGAFFLVGLQVVTTYFSTRQTQARSTSATGEQAQVMKMMLYIMPVFLGYLSLTFPIGVVLYWVTTNLWTIGQQALIYRNVEREEAAADDRSTGIGKPKAKQPEKPAKTTDTRTGRKDGRKQQKTPKPPAYKRNRGGQPSGTADESAKIARSGKQPRNGATKDHNGRPRSQAPKGSGKNRPSKKSPKRR